VITRTYEKSDTLPAVAVPDWLLIQRLVELFEQYGEVLMQGRDPRGPYNVLGNFEEFRAGVEAQDDPPESIFVRVIGAVPGSPGLDVFASAVTSAAWNGCMFNVTSEDEATVNHVSTRTRELFASARSRFLENTPTEEVAGGRPASTDLKSFLYNPWVVAIGSTLVAAAVIAAVVWAV